MLAALLLALGGCGGYRLAGVVASGSMPGVFLVGKDDPRLGESGIPGAVVQATIDPQRLRSKRLGATRTDADGRFEIAVSEAGAGFLEYQVEIVARAPGQRPVIETLAMPPSHRRLLIVMTAGPDTYQPPQDPIEETLRLGEPWMR